MGAKLKTLLSMGAGVHLSKDDAAKVLLHIEYLESQIPTGPVIRLSESEVQSGASRVKWAGDLIRQMAADHEGARSWLLNYGVDFAAEQMRIVRGLDWDPVHECAVATPSIEDVMKENAELKARLAFALTQPPKEECSRCAACVGQLSPAYLCLSCEFIRAQDNASDAGRLREALSRLTSYARDVEHWAAESKVDRTDGKAYEVNNGRI